MHLFPPRHAALRTGATLALAAAATAAQAQSTVTIYGIVDQGVTKTNSGTTPGSLLPGRAAPDMWTMKAGNTSRLGFRGQEDLGDGMYARFQIEHRFAADTGLPSNANVFWLGRSVVAAGSNKWGEVYMGREYSAAYWVPLFADPTYWSYVSQLGSPYTYANYTPVAATIEASNIRWANQFGYKTPERLGGFSAELATALGEGLRKRSSSGNAQYRSGPVWAGVAFDRLDSSTNLAIIAGGYDFGVVFPTFTVSKSEGGLNGNAKAYSLSVRAPIPNTTMRVYASIGRYNPVTNLDASMFGAGTEYFLSKRTLLYFNVGSAKRDGLTRTTAFDTGLKHTF